MNVKFMNPFLEAAKEVLQAETQVTVTRGTLSLEKSDLTGHEVTVILSLVGEVQGVVLYGLSIQTSLALVSRIMGQAFTSFDDLARSGIAELGNVITGQASIRLAEAGFASNITPPTLVQGKGAKISTLQFPRIVVPLMTEVGVLTVHIALRQTPANASSDVFVPLLPNAGL
ncbi:MAG TPA: chemotaxis protein CheX [Chloroflexi bacterium]|nr:chemotaxis protein CheX [Chloroflexota bacterium]